ncbi:hypothetical protein ACOJBO_12880 [Rhizobium beringeri]
MSGRSEAGKMVVAVANGGKRPDLRDHAASDTEAHVVAHGHGAVRQNTAQHGSGFNDAVTRHRLFKAHFV